MGPKKRNRGTHSKQQKAEEPGEEDKWDQSANAELAAIRYLLQGIPKSSHERVHRYWGSLSIDSKKEFLKIKVDDLKNLFQNPVANLNKYIGDIVKGAKFGESWIAWICFDCDGWHKDPDSCTQHIWVKALGILPPETRELFPPIVNKDWFVAFNERCWEPLDATAAIEMLENRSKSEEDSSPKEYGWPQLNDTERAKFLKNIQRELNLLLRHNCLTDRYLTHVIESAKDEISGLHEGSQILNDALDLSPYCICFLGVSKLKMIYGFLLKLVNACGLVIRVDKVTDPPDDLQNSNQIPEIEEEIHVIENGSCLLLDESLLHDPDTIESATGDDVIYTDPFLSWIFSGSCFEQWDIWDGIKADKINQQQKLVKTIQKEIEVLQVHCKKKCDLMKYDEALKKVEDLCLEEDENRENIPEYVQRSYESILKVRHEELSINEENVSKSEMDAITNVLEEAQVIKANQSGSEENPTGAYDLEFQMESYIKTAIEQLKGTQFEEICMIDGKILRNFFNMEQSKVKLRPASAFDFRGQFLPLLKTYLKQHLDDLAAQYANNSLLAEVDAEPEKGVKGGRDRAKHKEKTKAKKITKRDRKTTTVDITQENREKTTVDMTKEDRKTTWDLKAGSITIFSDLQDDEQHILDTNTADNSSAAPDKKMPLKGKLIEIQAKKRSVAEQEKEMEKEDEEFNIEINERISKMTEQRMSLAHERKELEDAAETIKVELEKLNDEDQDPAESEKGVKGRNDSAKHKEKTTTKKITKEDRITNTSDLQATHGDEQHVLDTNIADNPSAAPDKKKRLEERLIEIEAEKKNVAEREKEMEKEDEEFNIELNERISKRTEKRNSLAHEQKELEDAEETIKVVLEKLNDQAQDPSKLEKGVKGQSDSAKHKEETTIVDITKEDREKTDRKTTTLDMTKEDRTTKTVDITKEDRENTTVDVTNEDKKRTTWELKVGSITILSDLQATRGDEQNVLDTNTADNSSMARDKKKRLEERLIEIQAEKKSLAEQKKELEQEREQLERKEDYLTHQRKELEGEEETIRIELGKLDNKAQDPAG